MPLSYAEREEFYESLVARARRQGIACATPYATQAMPLVMAQAIPWRRARATRLS